MSAPITSRLVNEIPSAALVAAQAGIHRKRVAYDFRRRGFKCENGPRSACTFATQ
jgi:hypothetical protein